MVYDIYTQMNVLFMVSIERKHFLEMHIYILMGTYD